MDASPVPAPQKRPRPSLAPTGHLVVQNGPLKGTRRALGVPLTCIGRAPACDLRLDVGGVSPLHCLIAHGPGGFLVRDLGSEGGTQVNGKRIDSAPLRDGDLLAVGPFQLRLHVPRLLAPPQPSTAKTAPPPAESDRTREALRIQVAAVAAQQAALVEEEARLQERRGNLEQQEAQLAAHLKDKHARLLELSSQVQTARAALKHDREAYQHHVEKVTGDLSLAERDMLERRQQTDTERRRALSLQRRLRERYRRNLQAGRTAVRQREHELAKLTKELEKDRERLHQERAALTQAGLHFNSEVELRRRRMQDEWDRLSRDRRTVQEQQAKEAAELEAWQADLEQREAELEQGRQAVRRERDHWQGTRLGLEKEVAGLETRARNQRRKVAEQQQEIQRLESKLRDLGRPSDPPAAPATGSAPAVAPVSTGTALVPVTKPAPAAERPPADDGWQQRLTVLDELAGELADQRLQLAEQWDRLARAREAWQEEHRTAAAEMKFLASRLQERGETFLAREQELEQGADELRRRHEELNHMRQHLVGWQARLRARELAWEAERDRYLADLRSREELAERQMAGVSELRQRWARRRRRELQQLQTERAACEKVRQEYLALREERRRRAHELEDERGALAAQTVALEEYRQKCLTRTADQAAAERRVERLRRRWLTENAAALRALTRERDGLQAEVARLEERHAELRKRGDDLDAERATLAERQTGWEQRQSQVEAEQVRLRHELQQLQAQRDRSHQETEDLHNEIERIARQLLEEPDAPPTPLLEQAA